MKRLTCVFFIVLGLIALASTRATADTEVGSVTGAGQALFQAGAAFGVVNLDSLDAGIGVFIDPNGSASGVFHAVLAGHSLLGQSEITVEGEVSAGGMGPFGQANFSGVATVDLGDGTPSVPGIPFSVTVTGGSVVLALEATTLAPAGMSADSITIE
jgi:hypothetical protein